MSNVVLSPNGGCPRRAPPYRSAARLPSVHISRSWGAGFLHIGPRCARCFSENGFKPLGFACCVKAFTFLKQPQYDCSPSAKGAFPIASRVFVHFGLLGPSLQLPCDVLPPQLAPANGPTVFTRFAQ